MHSALAQPVVQNERAGMWIVLNRFFKTTRNLCLAWSGKRAFILFRFFASLLVFVASFLASPHLWFIPFSLFSRLVALLPASAGGPAGRLLRFLPISFPFSARKQTHTHTQKQQQQQ